MRCKQCEYPLWQIRARQCPECGTPFLPSEQEFTLNSVQFCCPHCGQDYYGTGEKGHLVPRTFACVKCARTIDMDEMVLLPTTGVEEKQTEVTVVPWVNRRGRNWFGAFFATMGMAMGNPVRMIRAVPEGSSGGRAFGYAIIHAYAQALLGGWPLFLFVFGFGMAAAAGGGANLGFYAAGLGALAAVPLLLLGWIALAHMIVCMTGPRAGGFARTAHAICYSAGNNFITGIPCVGFYFCWAGGLWWAISAGFMLAVGQKIRGWRAGLAVAVPLVVALGVVAGGVAAMVYYFDRQVSARMAASAGTMAQGQVQSAVYALRTRMNDATKPPLVHVAELMVDDQVMPYMLVDMTSGSGWSTGGAMTNKMNRVRVGGRTLTQWQMDGAGPRGKAAAQAAAGVPGDTVAYRVADTVFTHNGVDPAKHTDGGLWLVIAWPEGMDRAGVWTAPAGNGGAAVVAPVRTEVAVGRLDGRAVVVDLAEFDAELADQNARRAKMGLPALAHPADVAEGQAVGAGSGGTPTSGDQ